MHDNQSVDKYNNKDFQSLQQCDPEALAGEINDTIIINNQNSFIRNNQAKK